MRERDGVMRYRSMRRVARVVYVVAEQLQRLFIAALIGLAIVLALAVAK
jgi:hypothetical protein